MRQAIFIIVFVSLICVIGGFQEPLNAALLDPELDALKALYTATNGYKWNNNTNWMAGDPATWFGVTVINIGGQDHVTKIDLSNNNVNGPLPEEIGNLTRLKKLILEGNGLSNPIPTSIENLKELEYLYLGRNQFTGAIPAGLVQLDRLIRLRLEENSFTGEIPANLGKLTKLEDLYLQKNQLSGEIPLELANLTHLQQLYLNNNDLSGSIPTQLGQLSNLQRLFLNGNRLTGAVPLQLKNLGNLYLLSLAYNALYTDSDSLRTFLSNLESDWENTQTIAPTGLTLKVKPNGSVELAWQPVLFQAIAGSYEILYRTSQSGPYTRWGETADKATVTATITNLPASHYYYFVLRTRTDSHAGNYNNVYSDYSLTAVSRQIEIGINRGQLNFASLEGEYSTPDQEFYIRNLGNGTLNWSIDQAPQWLSTSIDSGSTSGNFFNFVTLSLIIDEVEDLDEGLYQETVTITSPEAINSPQTIKVVLEVKDYRDDDAPFGQFLTPLQGATVKSSIAVTGWALDDIGIQSVKIYREDEQDSSQLVYIGDATLVEGARDDIKNTYPYHPMNHVAGWGYMMLTNFLPNKGNGIFTFHAIASDVSGNETTLATRRITVDNNSAVKPFGAIDTPEQGGNASGTLYTNQGWVLTPKWNGYWLDISKKIPKDGSTIRLFIDGQKVQEGAQYDIFRSDIAELFPGYNNSQGALAIFSFDTTQYTNGIHTIEWNATDSSLNIDGIGSRYFTIRNNPDESDGLSSNLQNSGHGRSMRRPYDLNEVKAVQKYARPPRHRNDSRGTACRASDPEPPQSPILVTIKELQRVVIPIGAGTKAISSLPIGSSIDSQRGLFFWQPGVGYYGEYKIKFKTRQGKELTVIVHID
jgi:Leucine rich repeat/Leucine Rich Repeat